MSESSAPRCRFAPSPTGYLHLGGARTALFNYLFARRTGGVFILRIEDTDIERSTQAAVDAIFEGLEWLRIRPDEGPFFQSQRGEIYASYAKRLLSAGHAYRCYATQQELEQMREVQKSRGEKQRYDGRFRPSLLTPQDTQLPSKNEEKPFVIRFRAPQQGCTVFHDLVLDDVSTPNEELEDFIIVRSDGSPTYNFTVVADDIEMRITHVIRGSDHVSNTPKQVAMYQALGADLPKFVHVPMILGEDKKKLSKRHGATSVIEYRQDGYLPDAFVNYLVRLGWSHGDQELFSREELESVFKLESIGKSPAVFDFQKLRWVNGEHIKRTPFAALFAELEPFLAERGVSTKGLAESEPFAKLIDNLRERSQTLKEMADGCSWYFSDSPFPITEDQKKKAFTPQILPALDDLIQKLDALPRFEETAIEPVFNEILATHNLGMGKLGQPTRLALTGTMSSPPLFAVFAILGKARALSRLREACRHCS